jgi:hypothetical protein
MRHTLIIAIALLLSSCSAQWHLKRAIELDPNIIKSKFTTLTEVHKRDTLMWFSKTLLLPMPKDTVKMDTLVLPDTKPSFNPVIKKQGIITAKIWMEKGRLKTIISLDSTLIYNLRDSIRLKDAIIERQTTINKENTIVIEKHQTLMQRLEQAKQIAFIVVPLYILFRIFWFFRKRKTAP